MCRTASSWPGGTPEAEGAGFEFTPTLKPLEAHRERLLVLSGLDNTGAMSRTGNPGAHAKPAGAFMTGVEPLRTTSSASLQLGTSMDQILAQTIGQETPLPSLELGLEGTDTVNGVGTCDVGFSCAYQNRLAWSSPTTPLPIEANPRVVFERLFGSVESTDPGRPEVSSAAAGQHHRLGPRQGAYAGRRPRAPRPPEAR